MRAGTPAYGGLRATSPECLGGLISTACVPALIRPASPGTFSRREKEAAPRPLRALFAVAILAASAAGCTDYLARRETISIHSGNAAAHNAAVHTIDPWAPHASQTRIVHSGKRIETAVDRYNRGPPPEVPKLGDINGTVK
jgi:hypothetical protein